MAAIWNAWRRAEWPQLTRSRPAARSIGKRPVSASSAIPSALTKWRELVGSGCADWLCCIAVTALKGSNASQAPVLGCYG